MEAPLTEREIEMMEHYHDPISMIENLFPVNENAPHSWNGTDCECFVLYPYQVMMQNFSYLVAPDTELKEEQLVLKRKGAGDCYSIGSRNTGKTLSAKFDVVLSWIHKVREVCIASFDDKHVKDFASPVAMYLENHPFCKIFHLKRGQTKSINRANGGLQAISEHGCVIKSANEKVSDKDKVGEDFWGRHYNAFYYDEASLMSAEGTLKRIDAGYSKGYIQRLSGIPDLRIGSPLTKILKNEKLKRYIWRLPQVVRPDWSDEMKEERIREYSGEFSSGFRLNVMAEIMEGVKGFWDIARLKDKSFKSSRKIKYFEVHKDNFHNFKQNIVVEKMPGAEQTFICSDLGYGGTASEIIIIFKVGNKYIYAYNIPLFKLILDEQIEVFYWLYEQLGGAFIGLDDSTDHGAIASGLIKKGVPPDNITKVVMTANIEVDFEKDPETCYVLLDKNGQPIMKTMKTKQYGMQELERLMYSGDMEIPNDEKFFEEFNGFHVTMTGNTPKYGSSTHDDLHQSIPKDETVLCKLNNNIIVDTIENIANNRQYNDLKVPTYDSGKLTWQNAKIYKEKNKSNIIYDFHLCPGSYIKTTEGHSMLIWDTESQSLIEKLAKDVKVGDLLLNIDKKSLKTNKSNIQTIDYKIWNKHDKKFYNLEIPVDENLAYLFGMYCAEGFKTGENVSVLYCGDDKKMANNILELTTKYFNQFSESKGRIQIRKRGTQVSKKICSKSDFYSVIYNGQKIQELFSVNCGRGAKNKKVPDVIFQSPKHIIQAFLIGLIDGDGNEKGRITTTSRLLASGIYTLHSLLGKYSSIHSVINKCNTTEYYIKQGQLDNYYNNIPLEAFKETYSKSRGKKLNRNKLINGNYKWYPKFEKNKNILAKVEDFNFVKVKDIKKYHYNDFVYDLCVENTNNFVAGVGNIIVHNSFEVFAITRALNEFNQLKDKNLNRKRSWGTFGDK